MRANFDSPLSLSSNRQRVKVRGPLGWDPDGVQRVEIIGVKITQGAAQARGASGEFQRGDGNVWWCDADAANGSEFAPGEAVAVATARRTQPGPDAELFSWPQTIFLQ